MLSFVDCAKKGRPSGGDRDTIPPIIVRVTPENYTINFDEDEIKITFDEYIKLKDLQKNLIISPPLKYPPIITPLSTSKTLKIKISDTLKENTTYSINFGQSIVDNNEENAYPYYKYVFSTGTYIDSLNLKGSITDALLPEPDAPTTVMLYEITETFTDSTIYNEKPTYISITTDSTSTFELTNLKEGKYLLLALKENNPNYTFQPERDKIAFEKNFITLPNDSSYVLNLFKEQIPYRIEKPKLEGKTHLIFGFQGIADTLDITELSELPEDYASVTYRDRAKDTLHYWFKPVMERDSLIFKVKNGKQTDTVTARLRNLFQDTLTIKMLDKTYVLPKDSLRFDSNVPLVKMDSTLIKIIDKDTLPITASTAIDTRTNTGRIFFPKTEGNSYQISVLPGAMTDFYGTKNDSLSYLVKTLPASDYGTLKLTVENAARYPILIELVDSKFKLVAQRKLNVKADVYFENLAPTKYYLRVIYDDNQNGKWDTGAFLTRTAPEQVIYYPAVLDIRSNFNYNETFTLK